MKKIIVTSMDTYCDVAKRQIVRVCGVINRPIHDYDDPGPAEQLLYQGLAKNCPREIVEAMPDSMKRLVTPPARLPPQTSLHARP